MMKTNEQRTIHEGPVHQPVVPEELHELPDGIVVPDDLSGLQLEQPAASTRRTRAVRWLPWVAAGAVVAGGAVLLSAVLLDDGSEPAAEYTTAQVAVQQSIDEALAAQTPVVFELPNGTRLAPGTDAPAAYTTAQVAVQQAIDEALAAQTPVVFELPNGTRIAPGPDAPAIYTTAQQMVQQAIDEALAEVDR